MDGWLGNFGVSLSSFRLSSPFALAASTVGSKRQTESVEHEGISPHIAQPFPIPSRGSIDASIGFVDAVTRATL